MSLIKIAQKDIDKFSEETAELFYEFLQRAIDEKLNTGRDPERYEIDYVNTNIVIQFEVEE